MWDRNTKYFHHHASQRKKKNLIEEMEDDMGRIARTEEEVEEMAVGYYTKLFAASQAASNLDWLYQNAEFGQLTSTQHAAMSQDFTGSEVAKALNAMYPSKALGLEGSMQPFTNPFGP